MKIDKVQKLPSGKYKISLDTGDKITTYDDVILEKGLLYHKEVSFDDIKEITNKTEYYAIYYKAVKMIGTKYRSEKEIRHFLKDKELTKTKKEEIIKRLKDTGLINDERYMRSYINDRMYLSTDGPYAIGKALINQGIDEIAAEKAIHEIDETIIQNKLRDILIKKVKANHKDSPYMLKQKLVQNLSLKGFDKNMIASIFDTLEVKKEGTLEKEYQRQYKRLSSKYQGRDLYFQIKQKLYSKGFQGGEIDALLNQTLE
ncbi:MAG: RecX family transcriptional regulator [Bacilli bacterium]|nr:RecX family transcriptional regulator [Bacilli bacterium]